MGVARRAAAFDDDDDDNEEYASNSAEELDDDGLEGEDEDETTGRGTAVLGGMSGANTIRKRGSEYANEFKFESGKKHLLSFLEDEPFASYRQHWIEKSGKKSYICIGKGCPLCSAGDRASGKYAFNVWSYDDGDVKALIAGPMLLEAIMVEVDASRSKKLSASYWSLSRSGKSGKTSYAVKEVKARDLMDDFGIDPTDAEKLRADAELYKPSIFSVPTRAALAAAARSLEGDDEGDED